MTQAASSNLSQLDEAALVEQIDRLVSEGVEQGRTGDFVAATETFQRALVLIDSLEAPPLLMKAEALYWLGRSHEAQQDYALALPALLEALLLCETLAAEAASSPGVANIHVESLLTLGGIYHEKSNFGTALKYYRSSLAIAQTDQFTAKQARLQHNIGSVEAEIGQYEQAEEALIQAAELSEQIEDVGLEAATVFTLGWVAARQQKYGEAIAHYQTAITLFATVESQATDPEDAHSRKIRTLNNLGLAYIKQDNYAAASQALAQGMSLLTVQPDPGERAILLNSVGVLNEAKGDDAAAWSLHFQALRLSQQTGNAVNEIEVLLNLGQLMENQQKPAVAIFFYKQAIASIETIRQDLQLLSKSVQQHYTLTIEDFYRNLADLLLQQNRESEALEILDLLKLQEVSTYLNSNQRQGKDSRLNTASEAALLKVLETLPAETSLADFLAHPAAAALTSLENNTPFDLKAIESLKAALAAQPIRTAILYPLILEDRLEILLITPEGTVERFSAAVSQAELEESINDLQESLRNKAFDAKAPAQALYKWLIRPLDKTLASYQVENIIYLPDGALRYVPLAAFHDGQQWLVQKYQSHNITAAALNDLTAPHESSLSVMAGAFTDAEVTHRVEVGADPFDFPGLSAAKQEIENLSASIPDTVALLDADFTHKETLAAVGDRNILHLATHAKFIPGQPEDSFILFGDGEAVNMRSLREWQLPNVDLVVLSACQTANSIEGEGKEILGLGFQVRKTGAKAVIASLWAIDDNATAALMTQFYKALSTGQTKAQALRHAQIQLIESNSASDPYDWGAFVLIGNGQ